MGSTATKAKPKGWAKETKKGWTDDIAQQADVVCMADEDVGLLSDEDGEVSVDADVVKVMADAAAIQRRKLTIILREYGRSYCDEMDGYKGSSKAQIAFAGTHLEAVIEVADESSKRKPVTAWLLNYAEKFASKFAK